jgi:hypothetical protein
MTAQEQEKEEEQEARKEEDNKNKKKRKMMGLALVKDSEKVRHIGRKGGLAPHVVRGLQAASVQTRRRVSSLGGKIRASDEESMTHARELGKKVLREKYGADFYSVILNKGGKGGKGSKVVEEHYSVEIYDDDDG